MGDGSLQEGKVVFDICSDRHPHLSVIFLEAVIEKKKVIRTGREMRETI
jgi:hypothetical protein